ncbi:MAG TPA: efflux RND transporter periplasmic adaptor subunit [Anaerovoracaceae bacterium]|nr:efflux RND transporter periplasmic adaptor subunit [Anaerovoracaceae bacterium]
MNIVKNNKNLIITIAIILVLCTAFAVVRTNVAGHEELVIQGNIKTEETDLNSKIAGVVDQLLVDEGQEVKKGDTLVVISSESIEAKKQQAEAATAAAEAQYQKALNGARSQEVAQAKAAFDLAEKTYQRIKTLYEQEAVPANTYDQAFAQYSAAKEVYEMADQGAREEDKAAAEALVAQAKAATEEVQSYLDDAVIKAPMDGIVTALNVNEGELISSGMPLATLTSKEKPYVEINVKETDLGMIHIGDQVDITIAAYPDEVFRGKIVNVNQKPDFATKRATNNNGDFDVLSYRVKIELVQIDKDIYPGMTVMVNLGSSDGK